MRYQLIAPRDEAMSNVEQVLFNRGIKFEDIKHFRYPSEKDLFDPLLLDNITEGARMLISHI